MTINLQRFGFQGWLLKEVLIYFFFWSFKMSNVSKWDYRIWIIVYMRYVHCTIPDEKGDSPS